MRWIFVAIVGTLLAVSSIWPSVASPAAADCEYKLGFKLLHDLIPEVVGVCKGDETHNATNGDALQETVNGLLVWRKADNWTAFTNGNMTWLNGPCGVESRRNEEAFPWELTPGGPCGPPVVLIVPPPTRTPLPTFTPTATVPPTATGQATPQPAAPTPTPGEGSIERSGSSSQNTSAFALRGGDYRVEWEFEIHDEFGDNCIIWIHPTDDANGFGDLLLNEIYDEGQHDGINRIYDVAAGRYYFEVQGCGSWTITISPL